MNAGALAASLAFHSFRITDFCRAHPPLFPRDLITCHRSYDLRRAISSADRSAVPNSPLSRLADVAADVASALGAVALAFLPAMIRASRGLPAFGSGPLEHAGVAFTLCYRLAGYIVLASYMWAQLWDVARRGALASFGKASFASADDASNMDY